LNKPKDGLFAKIRRGLTKTREFLGKPISEIVRGGDRDQVFRDLEVALVMADVGIDLATSILTELREIDRKTSGGLDDVGQALRGQLLDVLSATQEEEKGLAAEPRVIFFVGVNGTGKTTTIGKLAASLQRDGSKPLLAACDTFRAAAVEQLAVWADRSSVPLVRQKTGADPAAVLHDALSRAKAKGESPVLVDTAGRLQAKTHLMDELGKMGRIAGRIIPGAPHESWLVLDATTGQNGISQAREFGKVVDLTGVVLTKLDGTAKGGIALAIAHEFGLPIRMVGVGEGIDDLIPFDPASYVDGLVGAPVS
jgi:fused signal recognition particle receptor